MWRSILALLAATGLTGGAALAEASPSGRDIVESYLATQDVRSELAYLSLEREGSTGTEEKRFLIMTRRHGQRRATILRFEQPEDVRGVTLLFIQEPDGQTEIFEYIPTLGKTLRVVGRARAGSFLGSDFGLEDLQREIPESNEYIRRDDALVRGRPVYVVDAISDPDDSSYPRRRLYLDRDRAHLLKAEFFREDPEPVKTLRAFGYGADTVLGETRRPERVVMRDEAKGTRSTMRVIESGLDQKIDPDLFTPEGIAALQRADLAQLLLDFGLRVALDE